MPATLRAEGMRGVEDAHRMQNDGAKSQSGYWLMSIAMSLPTRKEWEGGGRSFLMCSLPP